MADPFANDDDGGFENVSSSELLTPTGISSSTADVDQQQQQQQQREDAPPVSSSASAPSADDVDPFDFGLNAGAEPAGVADDATPLQEKVDDLFGMMDSLPEKTEQSQQSDFIGGNEATSEFDPLVDNSKAGGFDSHVTREATPPPMVKDDEPKQEQTSEYTAGGEPVQQVESTTSEVEKPVELPKQALQANSAVRNAAGCSSCSTWLKSIDPRVLDLILWRKPVLTGAVFSVTLLILIALTCCSAIAVLSNLSLAVLTTAFAVRIGKYVMVKVHKGEDVHPFQDVLACDLTIPEHKVEEFSVEATRKISQALRRLRSLIFVEDIVSSLKFGVVLYALTFIGGWFNGMTLLILAIVAEFTLPKIYEVNRSQIDQYVDVLQNRFHDAYRQLQDKVPYLKQKTQ